MATIEEQLNQLKQDKTVLVQNLVEKGIEASDDETFTELVPKVAEIQSGENIEDYISSATDNTKNSNASAGIQILMRIKKLPDLDLTNLKQDISLINLFQGLNNLISIPKIKIGDISRLALTNICSGCENLKDVSNLFNSLKDKQISSLYSAFSNCQEMENFTGIDELDTSELGNMNELFYRCYKLVNIPLFNTEKVTSMQAAFRYCSELKTIPQFNTAKCEDFQYMFYDTTKLESLPELDFSSAQKINGMIEGAISYSEKHLTSLGGFKNLGFNYKQKTNNYAYYKLDLSYCSALTRESVLNVFNGLADLNTVYTDTLYTQQIVLHPTVNSLLQPEDIAIATDKGWNITTQTH